MPLTAKALREKRAPLAEQIQQLAAKANDEGREFTADEQAAWDKANEDYKALTRQIDLASRAEVVANEQAAVVGDPAVGRDPIAAAAGGDGGQAAVTEAHRALAIQAWMRWQLGHDIDDNHREACRLVGL